MLDLQEIKQLIAFAEKGTLSKVAEEFHISTPSITRSMQHLEECFGIPLFSRGKNHIELNENGMLAVEYGRHLLQEAEQMVTQVRAADMRRRTIVVKSCAPAPLWELMRKLSAERPEKMISSAICQNDQVQASLADGSCDIGILPFPVENGREYMRENLFVCVPKDHELAGRKTLTFGEINGFNFLLRTQLGFWDTLCREKMPASKFLVQTDEEAFDELVHASSLPCFTTDYFRRQSAAYEGRVNIPLTDKEAQIVFYLVERGDARIFS